MTTPLLMFVVATMACLASYDLGKALNHLAVADVDDRSRRCVAHHRCHPAMNRVPIKEFPRRKVDRFHLAEATV